MRAENSGENGRAQAAVRRAINASSSARSRSTAQERLLGWRRKLESGWRRELPTNRIYVTALVLSKSSINKTACVGMAEALTWPVLAVHMVMVVLEGRSGNGSGEPEADIYRCLDVTNQDPKPFFWTKTADRILASVAHFCKRALDT